MAHVGKSSAREPSASEIAVLASPVAPQRLPGRRRVEAVLVEAEALLVEAGLAGFSIPLLAERLAFTRASIYKFFPTPYAILNALTQRQLDRLAASLVAASAKAVHMTWEDALREMLRVAARYHNENPAARILILGGAVTDEGFRATELTINRLGDLITQLLAQRGLQLAKTHPYPAALAVEIGTAVFRVSNFHFGRLTPIYVEEAYVAMRAYLGIYLPLSRASSARMTPASRSRT